jgi:hypothetical protein
MAQNGLFALTITLSASGGTSLAGAAQQQAQLEAQRREIQALKSALRR